MSRSRDSFRREARTPVRYNEQWENNTTKIGDSGSSPGQHFKVTTRRKYSDGAYGYTYLADYSTSRDTVTWGKSRTVIVKSQKTEVGLPREQFEEWYERSSQSIAREASVQENLRGVACVAQIIEVATSREKLEIRGGRFVERDIHYIVEEYVEGIDLEELRGQKLSAADWYRNAIAVASGLAEIHKRLVVHGDIRPTNIRRRKDESIVLIDFGQAVDLEAEFEQFGKSGELKSYIAPEKRERGVRWSEAADVYSAGAVMFFLATGCDPRSPEIHAKKSARDEYDAIIQDVVAQAISVNNPQLHEKCPEVAAIIGRCLRINPNKRPANGETLLDEVLDFFVPEPRLRRENFDSNVFVRELNSVDDDIFKFMANVRFNDLRRDVASMAKGSFLLSGTADDVAGTWARFLSALQKDDEYLAVSVPAIWKPENLGYRGRYMAIQEKLARDGVTIKRIFIIGERELRENSNQIRQVLARHRAFMERLKKYETRVGSEVLDKSTAGVYTGVVVVSESERTELEERGCNFALWRRPTEQRSVIIVPGYDYAEKYWERKLHGVRFLLSRDDYGYVERFYEIAARKCVSIEKYAQRRM